MARSNEQKSWRTLEKSPPSLPSLVRKLHRKLNLPWSVKLTADQAERCVRATAAGGIRLAKLNAIEKVEELRTKLQIQFLGDRSPFARCGVRIGCALRAQPIDARFISESVVRWLREAAGVEPLINLTGRSSWHGLAAPCDDIRARRTPAECGVDIGRLCGEDQREPHGVGSDAIHAPAGNDLVQHSVFVRQIALSSSYRQVHYIARHKVVGKVVAKLR